MKRKSLDNFTVTILYSLPSKIRADIGFEEAENDTVSSVKEMAESLARPGVTIQLFPLRPEEIKTKLPKITGDIIFNYIEWTGIDLPYAVEAFRILDSLPIPVTGATRENYHRTTDKLLMKEDFLRFRLPSPIHIQVPETSLPSALPFPYPAIVKLAWEHSGLGLSTKSIVKTKTALHKRILYLRATFPNQPILVEEFIDGREFEVTLLEQNGKLSVLPIAENVYFTKSKDIILTYEGRWAPNYLDYVNGITQLARLSTTQIQSIVSMCKEAYQKFGFRDYARFDLRMNKKGKVYFIEVNSNPGLDDNITSSLPLSFHAIGMSFGDFCWEVIKAALLRTGKQSLLPDVTNS